MRELDWDDIERTSGLTPDALTEVAHEYAKAKAVIAHYGMGLTQHRLGVQNVRMVVNLLLLRGNIGKPGAGPSPIRGHSNVQGQRTVGITENPELAPLDKLAEQFHFEPPRNEGMATVDACRGVIEGKVRAVLQLGGNLVRSVPDRDAIEPAWRKLRLTVGIATKLNRSHLVHGGVSYILPCLSRIEIDEREGVPQAVSMEDSTGCMHDSRGVARPAGDRLLAEPANRGRYRRGNTRRTHRSYLASLEQRLRIGSRCNRANAGARRRRPAVVHIAQRQPVQYDDL
jgi:formate dehydrogenase major subunit